MIFGTRFRHWFTYVCNENDSSFYEDIQKVLEFRFQVLNSLKSARSVKDISRIIYNANYFTYCRVMKKRPLMKDPLAIFSAEWLANQFDMDVVVLIQHPAAFAGSLKKANWQHPFNHFLEQPLLIQHYLSDFEPEIKEFAKKPQNIVDQAILLWNITHSAILKYKARNPGWLFVRHNDLSNDPLSGFANIFAKLNLPYPQSVQDGIRKFSDPSNPVEPVTEGSLRRNSKASLWNWKNRLNEEEIAKIREKTNMISRHFFTEDDWGDGIRPDIRSP